MRRLQNNTPSTALLLPTLLFSLISPLNACYFSSVCYSKHPNNYLKKFHLLHFILYNFHTLPELLPRTIITLLFLLSHFGESSSPLIRHYHLKPIYFFQNNYLQAITELHCLFWQSAKTCTLAKNNCNYNNYIISQCLTLHFFTTVYNSITTLKLHLTNNYLWKQKTLPYHH